MVWGIGLDVLMFLKIILFLCFKSIPIVFWHMRLAKAVGIINKKPVIERLTSTTGDCLKFQVALCMSHLIACIFNNIIYQMHPFAGRSF